MIKREVGPRSTSVWDVLKLLLKGLGVAAAAWATALAIFLWEPEANEAVETIVVKSQWLVEAPGRRIVLIGGSNLGYGVDSYLLEAKTGCSVVNTGKNGYLGTLYLLEEKRPYLRAGDIAVIAFEYDGYFKSIYGTAMDQLLLTKGYPQALNYLQWNQRLAMAAAVPQVSQLKFLRMIDETMDAIRGKASIEPGPVADMVAIVDRVESLGSANDRGDLTGHLKEIWPYELEDGVDITRTPRDKNVVGLIRDFTVAMRARGVDVLMSHTPVVRDYYERHTRPIGDLYHALEEAKPITVLSPPSRYVFERNMMFDTVYHLNGEGRRLRTEQLAEDISNHYKLGKVCS